MPDGEPLEHVLTAGEVSNVRPEDTRSLVLCMDGTWNDTTSLTNVYHLCLLLHNSVFDPLATGSTIDIHRGQISFYLAGVGTGVKEGSAAQDEGGMLGVGVVERIKAAYIFLLGAYLPGDRVCLFGFSRGSFTALTLAKFVNHCGIPEVKSADFKKTADKNWRDFAANRTPKWGKNGPRGREVFILGMWDCVEFQSDVELSRRGRDDDLKRTIKIFHALSRDDKRPPFLPHLVRQEYRKDPKLVIGMQATEDAEVRMLHARSQEKAAYLADGDAQYAPFTDTDLKKASNFRRRELQQVFFPGDHCDVGGGHADDDTLSRTALTWMLSKCSPYLEFQKPRDIADWLRNGRATAPLRALPHLDIDALIDTLSSHHITTVAQLHTLEPSEYRDVLGLALGDRDMLRAAVEFHLQRTRSAVAQTDRGQLNTYFADNTTNGIMHDLSLEGNYRIRDYVRDATNVPRKALIRVRALAASVADSVVSFLLPSDRYDPVFKNRTQILDCLVLADPSLLDEDDAQRLRETRACYGETMLHFSLLHRRTLFPDYHPWSCKQEQRFVRPLANLIPRELMQGPLSGVLDMAILRCKTVYAQFDRFQRRAKSISATALVAKLEAAKSALNELRLQAELYRAHKLQPDVLVTVVKEAFVTLGLTTALDEASWGSLRREEYAVYCRFQSVTNHSAGHNEIKPLAFLGVVCRKLLEEMLRFAATGPLDTQETAAEHAQFALKAELASFLATQLFALPISYDGRIGTMFSRIQHFHVAGGGPVPPAL